MEVFVIIRNNPIQGCASAADVRVAATLEIAQAKLALIHNALTTRAPDKAAAIKLDQWSLTADDGTTWFIHRQTVKGAE